MNVFRSPRALAIGLLLIYVVVARGVGNLYPWSTFEMYGGVGSNTASQIVVRDAQGQIVPVNSFRRYNCNRKIQADPQVCGELWPFDHLPYKDAAAAQRINGARAPTQASQQVEVLRRVWRFVPELSAPQVRDCSLARCQAR